MQEKEKTKADSTRSVVFASPIMHVMKDCGKSKEEKHETEMDILVRPCESNSIGAKECCWTNKSQSLKQPTYSQAHTFLNSNTALSLPRQPTKSPPEPPLARPLFLGSDVRDCVSIIASIVSSVN